MITMQMGDEEAVKLAHARFVLPHLKLCPLTAVDHKELLMQVYQLRRGVVQCGGHCRSATQYGYLEFCHISVSRSVYVSEGSMPTPGSP